MTWTKLGDEFWDDCANAGLSDAAARTHAEAIGWLYRIERTDLRIPTQLVRRFAGSPDWETAVKDLVAAGFWRDTGDAYVVEHHADVILASIAAQRRKRERDKRSQRAWRKRNTDADVSGDVSDYADRQTVKTSQDRSTDTHARENDGYPDDLRDHESWVAQAAGYDN